LGGSHRAGAAGPGAPLRRGSTRRRRRRLRLGPGGHHRVREGAGRPGLRRAPRRPRAGTPGGDARAAAHAGDGVPDPRRPPRPRTDLVPPRVARGPRERPARRHRARRGTFSGWVYRWVVWWTYVPPTRHRADQRTTRRYLDLAGRRSQATEG